MKLNQLQAQFSAALFYQHDNITDAIKETQSVTPLQRLQVYRNSFIMGVTEALAITYQHTSALVGEEFFNSVSRAFILNNPPLENNIMTYGLGFNEYLATLPQLTEMPYIAEMARFEWLLEQTSNAEVEDKQFDTTQLALVPENQLNQLLFQVATQITLFDSQQNISQLYQMIIADAVVESDLNNACYVALKKQPDFRIELISLNQQQFLLLQQIIAGKTLGEVSVDLHQQLPILLEKQLINGFTITKDKR
ncbi:DUF2063 domain-containing protein [Psychromonas marina]|uniref:DUF2063 domain-containing protein n=1 Tax=Psychromonas marina TaxID=88364 RepID=A0ABQ6DVM6_9GAMM|nr:DNA-binding domain-containing protein [Psychromonas marina]GLS89063.1 DUF2063 domain-containing protein [Psychromonas marina]